MAATASFAGPFRSGDDPMSAEYRRIWGPAVQAGIDERIEKFRKADAVVGGFSPGEAVQAEALRDLYRLWFSWPSVHRITYWNLVDFTYHRESLSSGFYRRDMTKKPVYHVLDDLLNREWKTRLSVTAAKDGSVAFRGFRGRYRLSCKGKNGNPAYRFVDVQ